MENSHIASQENLTELKLLNKKMPKKFVKYFERLLSLQLVKEYFLSHSRDIDWDLLTPVDRKFPASKAMGIRFMNKTYQVRILRACFGVMDVEKLCIVVPVRRNRQEDAFVKRVRVWYNAKEQIEILYR